MPHSITEYAKVVQAGDFLEVYSFQFRRTAGKPKRDLVFSPTSDAVYTKNRPVEKRAPLSYRRLNNLQAVRKRFVRLCRVRLTRSGTKPLLLTLTFAGEARTCSQAYVYFRLGMQRFRTYFGSEFAYIAVPEFHPKGHGVHFHLLVWGIPEHFGDVRDKGRTSRKGSERTHRILAGLWGFGFVDCQRTDGNERLAGYLSKYLTKALEDVRYLKVKCYTRSRNYGDFSEFGTENVETVLLYLGFLDIQPLYEHTWSTRWMGECNYQLFNKAT